MNELNLNTTWFCPNCPTRPYLEANNLTEASVVDIFAFIARNGTPPATLAAHYELLALNLVSTFLNTIALVFLSWVTIGPMMQRYVNSKVPAGSGVKQFCWLLTIVLSILHASLVTFRVYKQRQRSLPYDAFALHWTGMSEYCFPIQDGIAQED